MLKESARTIAAVVFIADLLLVAVAFVAAHWLRAAILPGLLPLPKAFYPLAVYLPLLPLALLIWGALLLRSRCYRSRRTTPLKREAWDLLRISIGAGLLLVVAIFAFRLDQRLLGADRISRLWIVLFIATAYSLLLAQKITLRATARQFRLKGKNYRTLLLVGSSETAKMILDSIKNHRFWGFRVLGLLTEEPEQSGKRVLGYPVLGCVNQLEEIVQDNPVDEVIFTVAPDELGEFESYLVSLQEMGICVRFALKPHPVAIGKVELSDLEGVPLISYSPPPEGNAWLQLKRLADVLAVTVLLVFWAPFMLLISLALKASSRGPVLFRQTRIGLNGRRFTLHKFRTMVAGAEQQQERLAHLNEMTGPVFKASNDPRITRFGGFLRRYSLDELPQFWNVLKGEMSLVGPRPPLPEEVSQYQRWQKRRLSMRPGLTCLWQVSGRSKIDFEKWMELDLEYIDNWSPELDLKILLRTIPAVLSGSGAH